MALNGFGSKDILIIMAMTKQTQQPREAPKAFIIFGRLTCWMLRKATTFYASRKGIRSINFLIFGHSVFPGIMGTYNPHFLELNLQDNKQFAIIRQLAFRLEGGRVEPRAEAH